MPAHAHDLDDRLEREDGRENDIHEVERLEVGVALLVVLDRHGDHVADDEDDDGQLELGAHRHVEEEALNRVLRAKNNNNEFVFNSPFRHVICCE